MNSTIIEMENDNEKFLIRGRKTLQEILNQIKVTIINFNIKKIVAVFFSII